MLRKTLSLIVAGLLTFGVAAMPTQAAGTATQAPSIEGTHEVFHMAWGFTPADADNSLRDLEARGYHATSPLLFGFVSSAGGNAYYYLVSPF